MATHVYRWPVAFIVVAAAAAMFAFFIPSALASWILGAIAFVFAALVFLSLPTAIGQDSDDRPDDKEMKTTLGPNG